MSCIESDIAATVPTLAMTQACSDKCKIYLYMKMYSPLRFIDHYAVEPIRLILDLRILSHLANPWQSLSASNNSSHLSHSNSLNIFGSIHHYINNRGVE